MYCFSSICRICLANKTDLIDLNKLDIDNVTINDKLLFCIPEIFHPYDNLPEEICLDCYQLIQRMYDFKQVCIDNTIKLYEYSSKLSSVSGIFNKYHLFINLGHNLKTEVFLTEQFINSTLESSYNTPEFFKDIVNTEDTTHTSELFEDIVNTPELFKDTINIPEINTNISNTEDTTNTSELFEDIIYTPEVSEDTINIPETNKNISSEPVTTNEVPMHSVSLNQWDSFETKYTCRCIKEFSSFTENTKHLCQNCKGELLGFRLSKIKAGVAEGRYNINFAKIRSGDEEIISAASDTDTYESDDSEDERGFDSDDLLLCKLHFRAVKKQIRRLEENINFYVNNKSGTYYFFDNDNENELHKCPYCAKKFLNFNNFDEHKLSHRLAIKIETSSSTTSESPQSEEEGDFDNDKSENDEDEDENDEDENDEDEDENDQEEHDSSNLNSSGEIQACGTCDKIFPSKGKLAIHLMTHVGRKYFKCHTCDKEFFRKENYDAHLKTHDIEPEDSSQNGNAICPLCKKSYMNFMHLRRHVKETHNVRRYLCIVCDRLFNDRELLYQHIDFQHSIYDEQLKILKYKCTYCDKNYFKAQNVRRHIRDNHNILTSYCSFCKLSFHERNLYEEHVIFKHSSDETIFNKVVPSAIPILSNDTPRYKCPCCEKTYSLLQNVKRHLKSHHPSENPEIYNIPVFEHENEEHNNRSETFTCEKCGKFFYKVEYLRRHMKEAHGIKHTVICAYCTKNFKDSQTLNNHILEFHKIENPVKNKQNIFDKTIPENEDIDEDEDEGDENEDNDDEDEDDDHDENEDDDDEMEHEEIEENTKKYKCLYCEKSYNHNANVRRHMRDIHNIDKYLCSICNKTFTDKHILEEHIFEVHTQTENKTNSPEAGEKQKSFSCPVCKKKFNHMSNLRMHALSHAEMTDSQIEYTRCPICMKNISKRSSMSRHLMTHNRSKIYDCLACSAKFDNRWVRAQHMKSQHPNFVPVFKCTYCPKTYNSKFSLGKHEISHTN